MNCLFLEVEKSVCGRAWRDRLDERGTARALSMTQRHGVSELLARVLAGRGVEIDDVPAFLDPTIRTLLPDPDTLTDMPAAATRIADAVETRRADRDLRRLRRRRRDLVGGAGAVSPLRRPRAADPHPGPAVRGLRAEHAGRPQSLAERGAKLLVTVDCGTTSIEPLAEAKAARARRRRHRSPPGRRDAAAGGRDGQSEPAGRYLRPRPSRRGGARVHDGGGGQSRTAHARLLAALRAGAGPSRPRSISSRSAPSPTWCR